MEEDKKKLPIPFSSDKKPFTVGFLGSFALAGASLVYLFSTTYQPEAIDSFFTMFLIMLAGVVLSKFFVGWRLAPFSFRNIMNDIIATVVAFFAIYYVNQMVPVTLGISPIGETAFAILSGVAEEWMFRLFLCAWAARMTGSKIIAILVSSGVWAWFHLARASAYGLAAVNWNYIWLVFLAGIPLGFITLYFRSADGPTFGHMLINALAGSA